MASDLGWSEFLEKTDIIKQEDKWYVKCFPNKPFCTKEEAEKMSTLIRESVNF